MDDSALEFYNKLANDYHLIYADWKQSVLRQGELLDRLIRSEMGAVSLSLLDCSCGIGTQVIGLATRGYKVHATDLSPAAVERAAKEAQSFGASLTFGVADFRALETQVAGTFDVVITCDNSLPHLLSDEDLLLAARNIRSKLRPNGLFLASIRDYDQIAPAKPRATMPGVFDDSNGRHIVFQVWDWAADGRTYTLHHFIVKQVNDDWQAAHRSTHYRTLLRSELDMILREAGFSQIHWHMPDESGYYQPIVTARQA